MPPPITPSSPSGATSWFRASQSWTDATSAAGFTLRYLIPVRRQLIAILESEEEADEGLRLLIGHLIKVGFGDRSGGRLRDHLLKAVRSAARACHQRRAAASGRQTELPTVASDSPLWLRFWRDCLLERTWRALERLQHAEPSTPLFSVLHTATRAPQETPAMLAVRIAAETGLAMDERRVKQTLPQAREIFARLLTDEIRGTLDKPGPEEMQAEIQALGLGTAVAASGDA